MSHAIDQAVRSTQASLTVTERKIRLGIVFGSDFRGNPPGGGQPTIEIFLKYAQDSRFDISLLGMATSKEELVGQRSTRSIYGREYTFIPLFYFESDRYASTKPFVPLRLQALWAYIRRKRMVEALGFDVLYLHAPEAMPFLWAKKQPVLYHIHGTQESAAEYSRYAIFKSRLFLRPYRLWVDSILRRADEFIVIDHESYDRYTSRMPNRSGRFHLLPTAIDVDHFKPFPDVEKREIRHSYNLPINGKMVLYVGRLSWKKGVDLILKAFALVNQQDTAAFLVIAGEGEDREQLETLAQDLGIGERVFFLGQVPHLPKPDLPRLFNCADVSVVASVHESLALVITEALACGLPVVSTSVGIAPAVIRDGVTGYLLQSREPLEMADRVLRITRDQTYSRDACVSTAQEYADTSRHISSVITEMYRSTNESRSSR